MSKGEYDLLRVYWWEQRWREGTRNPQKPKKVVFFHEEGSSATDSVSDVTEVRKTEVGTGRRHPAQFQCLILAILSMT